MAETIKQSEKNPLFLLLKKFNLKYFLKESFIVSDIIYQNK
jgi:hypothetical protein